MQLKKREDAVKYEDGGVPCGSVAGRPNLVKQESGGKASRKINSAIAKNDKTDKKIKIDVPAWTENQPLPCPVVYLVLLCNSPGRMPSTCQTATKHTVLISPRFTTRFDRNKEAPQASPVAI